MANTDDTDWLRRRLDMIIQLLMETAPGGAKTTSSKIERLLGLGFSQAEAAQVVGKKVNYVTAVVAMKKKSEGRRQKKKAKGEAQTVPTEGRTESDAL
jgi:hypothetical protein